MNTIDFLTDDALVMTITTNFRKDFKKLKTYFNLDFEIEFPELNFVYKSFNKETTREKRSIFGCTKAKFIFDCERGERYVISFPMINIYPIIIAEYIKRFSFKNEIVAYIYFARITLLHELIHYFQLADKIFFSQLLEREYDKFDDKIAKEVVEMVEYKCVSDLVYIVKTQYKNDDILNELVAIEIIEFEYLFSKIEESKYETQMSERIEALQELLL